MISLRIRGCFNVAGGFLTSTRLFSHAESLGGVESLAEHPAMMYTRSAESDALGLAII